MSNLRTVLQDTDPIQTGPREEWASSYAGGHHHATDDRRGELRPGWQPVHDAPALTDEQIAHLQTIARRRREPSWLAMILVAVLYTATMLAVAWVAILIVATALRRLFG